MKARLTYTSWLERNRPADSEISDTDFERRLKADSEKRRDAFVLHMYSMGLLFGLGVMCFLPALLPGVLSVSAITFLYYGWKCWT